MATIGFPVTDEVKQQIDTMSEQFATAHPGSRKADFLNALVNAYEMMQARTALPGRTDDIDNIERLLSDIRNSYLHSLALAKTAREEADKQVITEIEQGRKIQTTLQTRIDELKTKLTEAETKAAKINEVEQANKKLEAELTQAKTTIATITTANEQYQEHLREAKAQLVDVDKTKSELASAQNRIKELEHNLQQAKIEQQQAVLDAKRESSNAINVLQQDYHSRILEMLKATATVNSANEENNTEKSNKH